MKPNRLRIVIGALAFLLQSDERARKIPQVLANGFSAEQVLRLSREIRDLQGPAHLLQSAVIEAPVEEHVPAPGLGPMSHESPGTRLHDHVEQGVVCRRDGTTQLRFGRWRIGLGGREQAGDVEQLRRLEHARAFPNRAGSGC